MKTCAKCKNEFEITKRDFEFYKKVDVPEPTLCPICRSQRRMNFRNERSLYYRKCDSCGKNFLSNYDVSAKCPVYCHDCWWSDKWDARDFGRDYDFNRSFFEQARELFDKVPHLGISNSHCENCDYVNYTNYSKNCYLVLGCHEVEDCYYCWRTHNSLQCVDCLQVDKSRYCYNCIECNDCYELFYSQDCEACSSSKFLYDCKGCQFCAFSAGLRNKTYCIFNKQYSKKEYFDEIQKVEPNLYKEFLEKYPRRAAFILNSENAFGDHILNAQNVNFGFNVKNVQDCSYIEFCTEVKDAMDSSFCGWPAELNYEGISAGCVDAYNVKFSVTSWSVSNIEYCDSCHHSKDLFGCFGMRHKNNLCILNKQYDEVEYDNLRKRIIENMKSRKEYGEFFPVIMSPFAYNETVANDFYPMNKEDAIEKGFTWKDSNSLDYKLQKLVVSSDIKDVSDAILDEILTCEKCCKNYKIVLQELQFYRKFNLPIPRKCFSCRHKDRFALLNPHRLYKRECAKCGVAIQTPYSKQRPEKVYCEECYLEEVY